LPIDLRSDTVTRPSQPMRAAIAAALSATTVRRGSDDQRMQRASRRYLGKEAALFFPSGTMVNQVALRVLTRPGDEVIVSREAHLGWHETGGAAANSGVQ
jgi:threonine aldolase